MVYRLIFEKSEKQTYYLGEKGFERLEKTRQKLSTPRKRKQQERFKANFLPAFIVLKWKSQIDMLQVNYVVMTGVLAFLLISLVEIMERSFRTSW